MAVAGGDRTDAADSGGPAGAFADAPRAAVVCNPSKSRVDALRDAVAAAEARQGWAPSLWMDTSEDDPGAGMAAAALQAGVQLVIAAGGDGTVRAVAGALRGTGTPMGIVPLGTGNLFARNIGVPVDDLGDAVVLAFAGVDRRYDVLVIDLERPDDRRERHTSLVMAGVGLDAAMIAKTNPELKRRLGWLAYIDGGLRAFPASTPFRVDYRLDDGHARRSRASSLLVANLGILPGNLPLVPDAALDDGLLDLVVLQPRSVFGWLFIWRRVAWENRIMRRSALGRQLVERLGGDRRREIVYRRGAAVELRIADGESEEFEIDGDEFGRIVAGRFRVDPGSLLVRVAE